jgi:PAS domain S-box-containing protein
MNALINSNLLEKILLFSSDMICLLDQQGKFIFVSEACKNILGYASWEMTGRSFTDFICPEDVESAGDHYRAIAAGASVTDYRNRYRHRSGQVVYLSWSATFSAEDNAFFAVARDITQVRQYVARLKESKQRFKSLFENSPYLIFFQSREGKILEVNAAGEQLLGFPRDQFLAFHQSAIVDSPQGAIYQKVLQEVLETRQPKRLEIEAYYLGESRMLDITKIPVMVNKEVIGVYTILQDVTQEKRAMQTVAQQALKLQTIFESITDAFFILDKTWQIVFVNSEWERLIELSRKEVVGRNLWEVFPGQVSKTFYQQFHYAINTGRAVHFEAYFEEGNLWLEVKAFPSEEGLSVYFNQISEKIRLRQELEKLSKVASNTRYGVVIANNQGDIEWANNSFSQITGYQPQELAGKNVVDILLHPSLTPDLYGAICQALGQSEFYIGEIPFVSKDQTELWLNLEITTVHDEAQAIKWYILLVTDITLNKLVLEERTNFIRELQRHNQSLEQFSHIVSHNLRAPVANILGLTSILEACTEEDPNYFVLQGLKTAAGHLDSIIRDLNQILAIRGNLQQVREQVVVADELKEVLLTFQHEIEKYHVTVSQDFSQAPVIHTVRAYFKSILFNLVSNAIKFRASDRPAHISVSTVLQQEAIVLTVQDNGIGFNMEKEKNKVFGLYKRFHSHIEGKGLGLFWVKTQIEALGGKVKVQSQVGEGSLFKVYFDPNG